VTWHSSCDSEESGSRRTHACALCCAFALLIISAVLNPPHTLHMYMLLLALIFCICYSVITVFS
jgi:hypothetical protein